MDEKALERKCITLYGESTGRKLFEAMRKLHARDFCVATGWNSGEVSISRSCDIRGRIFRFTPDYAALVMPDKKIIDLDDISYSDIESYLPPISHFEGEHQHCSVDE